MGKGNNSGSNKSARDNRANQMNPNNPAYYQSRGAEPPSVAPAVAPATGDGEPVPTPSDGETATGT